MKIIEDLFIDNIVHLQDPLTALRQISRDPSCKTRISLRNGSEKTAVEIQKMYMNQAESYFERFSPSEEEEQIMNMWRQSLESLQSAPEKLFGKVDWITKKVLMDRYL